MRGAGLKRQEEKAGRRCATCRHFDNSTATFERAFPGMASFGSAAASVRDRDGICTLHQLHLAARSGCEDH